MDADELALIKVTDVDGQVGVKLEDGKLTNAAAPFHVHVSTCLFLLFSFVKNACLSIHRAPCPLLAQWADCSIHPLSVHMAKDHECL